VTCSENETQEYVNKSLGEEINKIIYIPTLYKPSHLDKYLDGRYHIKIASLAGSVDSPSKIV